jgi:hypothetical protein
MRKFSRSALCRCDRQEFVDGYVRMRTEHSESSVEPEVVTGEIERTLA